MLILGLWFEQELTGFLLWKHLFLTTPLETTACKEGISPEGHLKVEQNYSTTLVYNPN